MKLLSKSILVVGLGVSAVSAQAELQTYVVDASHTAVEWHISHFGFSNPSGKFMNISGSVKFDPKEIQQGSVEIRIPIKDINTGVSKLDEHLLSADFFDVTKYPTAQFKSTSINNIDDRNFTINGDLTLHGVTKSVVLKATFNKAGMNFMKEKTVGFSASGVIDRTNFGMDTYSPNLGNEVKLDIELEANIK